ncbi:30S ribosomal protein-like protein S7 [Calycina marina]|uniref:Small ribosomal subunit protein uS7m n=1 Tax=Calycina marina TaxID=1763456 RepID=A0A9P7Z1K1_9HELO|nr:30S ribosomal protein-like protein S7 [Calycina marina]
MPPRLNIAGVGRSIAIRMRPQALVHQSKVIHATSRRCYADDKKPSSGIDPDFVGIGHVSEEAAEISESTGEMAPDMSQGTPVQEILKRDGDMDQAPEVIKKEEASEKSASNNENTTFAHLLAMGQMRNIAAGGHGADEVQLEGLIYELPELPIASDLNLKHRYDPVIEQVTNLIMQHGKKSVAQRNMAYILNHLRTAPPPTPSAARPLLPGASPASELPLDPVAYLTLAIDSVAPLIRIRAQKGAAGGGAALQIPIPLGVRQRRRTAVQWIIDTISKRKARGSGRGLFAQRFAEELVAIVEGRSGAWDRRTLIHKTGTSARANLNFRGFARKF